MWFLYTDHLVKLRTSLMTFYLTLSKFSLIFFLIACDFNVKTSSWWRKDSTTSEGTQTEALICSYELNQLISSPTHILQNSSSCIDLIFTNHSNLEIDSGVYPY